MPEPYDLPPIEKGTLVTEESALPPLVPRGDDATRDLFVRGASQAPPGSEVPQAPAADAERVAVDDLGAGPASRRPRTAAERIAQLTRRNYETKTENTELRAELARLSDRLAALPNILSARAPAAPAPAKAGSDPIGELLNGGAAPAAAAPVSSSPADVSAIIRAEFETRDQKARAEAARLEQLRSAQIDSFGRAAVDLPALNKAGSQAQVLFNQLFEVSPLRHHPDGPEHIALQVRGLLADERASSQPAVQQRKVQAAVTPNPSPTDTPAANRGAVETELRRAYQQMQSGDTTPALHTRIQQLKAMLRTNA